MSSSFLRADELGIRLSVIDGLPIWEPSPSYRHQKAIDVIRASITPVAAPGEALLPGRFVHAAGVYVVFRDGSITRPDIAIFSREPSSEAAVVRILPEAVIEVVSQGFERKDTDIAPSFYLSQGVKDVVVYNPYTERVLHFGPGTVDHHNAPVELTLSCGCRVRI